MASPEPPPTRVLLVDDDRDDYLLTRDLFAEIPGTNYALDWVSDYDAGLNALCSGEHDVGLIDYRLGAKTGLDLLSEARRRGATVPAILFTGQTLLEIDLAAMAAGAADYLEKGRLDATLLERSIRYVLQQKRYESDLERTVRERTAALARANESLREADRRKDEFLATLAHELRNPLAPIRNALEIMRLAGGNPSSVEQARLILDRQVRQMVRLIDDLLDVSRITRGKLQLTPERVTLGAVIEAALELSGPLVEKGDVALAVDAPTTPVWLHADRVRLAQVFSNLLNNAAKFTEAGGRVSLAAETEARWVIVRVTDTGVGIPPDVLPHVFDLFTQVDRTLNRSQGGLGIGLALVKRLVEMHGGEVSAESEGVGKGTTFVVRLPVVAPGDELPA